MRLSLLLKTLLMLLPEARVGGHGYRVEEGIMRWNQL